MSRDRLLALACRDAFTRPERHLERLYDLAVRDRWQLSDMDWDSIDFHAVPAHLRQSAATMFTQLHYGEMAALAGALKLAERSSRAAVRRFAATQAEDEVRHVRWFAQLLHKLDARAEVVPCVEELMKEMVECEDLDASVVGLHILVEGMAHSFFMEGARCFSRLNAVQRCLAPYRSAHTVLAEWLPNFLGRDEGRHIAFGMRFLEARLCDTSPTRRALLERRVQRWCDLLVDTARSPAIIAMPELDGVAIQNRCFRTINQRLASVGLVARVVL